MSIQPLRFDTNADEHLAHVRGQLLSDLSTAINSLEQVTAHIDALRAVDIEFRHGRDGSDVAAFLDDSIRYGRAAYAVVHTIIDKETLW